METIVARISIMLVPALMAVTCHEVAHGYLADRLGDPTARLLGRITLNPLRHLDPVGTLALLFFGFGWARPVPVNFSNLRRPKTDMIWVALSGPLTNLVLAGVSAALLKGLVAVGAAFSDGPDKIFFLVEPLSLMLAFSLYINVILGVFNLLPIPPLDGGRVMMGLLPPKQAEMLARLEPFGFVIIVFLIFFTGLWTSFFQPLIAAIVVPLAGDEIYLVAKVIAFLLGH